VNVDSFHLAEAYGREVLKQAIEKVSDHIAAEFIEKHGQEIAAKLDPVAIANLVIADGAAKTRELLDKKLPDRVEHHVREITKTEVYQRGVLGGLKRLR
jgi:hypothetical protein